MSHGVHLSFKLELHRVAVVDSDGTGRLHGSQWLRVAAGAQSGLLCSCIAVGLELCWGCTSVVLLVAGCIGGEEPYLSCFRSPTYLLGLGLKVAQKSHGFPYWAV